MIEWLVGLVSGLSIEQLGIGAIGTVVLGWVAVRQLIDWLRRVVLKFAFRKAVVWGLIGTGAGELLLPDGVVSALSTAWSLLPI